MLFEFYTDDTLNLLPGYFEVRNGSFLAESIVSLSKFWGYQQHSLQHAELKRQFECFGVCHDEICLLLSRFVLISTIMLLCTSSNDLFHYQIFSCNFSVHSQQNHYF